MKKNQIRTALMVLVSILVLSASTVGKANAQFSLGLKVAGNAVNYMGFTERKFGLETGLFMRLGQNFFFQPEVNYVFKNSRFKDVAEEFSSNCDLKQHYIAVPALLGYHFINNENFKFRLTVGPRFDFKIADNMQNTEWTSNVIQWGGQVGMGIDFWRFALDFNYCFSADKFINTATSTSVNKNQNMFILSLGFKIVK